MWAGLVAFAVLAYVILDGFDLGVGILFPLFRNEHDKDIAMNSVAPVWDGNETWLVLGGGGLFAVFPLTYATILPALYAPIIAMLLALVFRGVSFEFRHRTTRRRFLWDIGFAGGSVVAAYARKVARATGAATFVLIGLVSLITPFLSPVYLDRWFAWPSMIFSIIVPVLLLACAWLLHRGLVEESDAQPFLATLGFFVLCYAGILISFYPYVVPPRLTIWQAAAPGSSLKFLLIGAVLLIPIILAYTAYAYWVFRGKVDPAEGYH